MAQGAAHRCVLWMSPQGREMSSQVRVRVGTWAWVAVTTVLISSFTSLAATSVSAASPVTLYVNGSATGSSCLDDAANACPTIQDAITVAETYTSTDVTIDVAEGAYPANDTINRPASDTLTIQGASATTTFVKGASNGLVITIGSGGPVTLNDLSEADTTLAPTTTRVPSQPR